MTHSYSYPGTDNSPYMSQPSLEEAAYIDSPPSSPHSLDYSSLPMPHFLREDELNLQERRQRNKAASAKYRQKKNMQQHEMRVMIQQLSERNALLERQMYELREDNHKLRTTTDKLRGRCVAKKMLRQWMEKREAPNQSHHQSYEIRVNEFSDVDDDLNSLCSDI
ncbi:hypothetical protein A0J61_00542 [Choanephora cucurbitarum]|uniref:BZIP domain-containing protein n=1 Tax=Choanephora cucurbitarum TaxID=101091 RepID=A0A1C7NQM0_9FUNG|nr:hypothetical protein A0J61_00542 [Choanephora cucurbitarum]